MATERSFARERSATMETVPSALAAEEQPTLALPTSKLPSAKTTSIFPMLQSAQARTTRTTTQAEGARVTCTKLPSLALSTHRVWRTS